VPHFFAAREEMRHWNRVNFPKAACFIAGEARDPATAARSVQRMAAHRDASKKSDGVLPLKGDLREAES